ncbi:MAG: GFA family protein [Rhodobacteraceae bacterium]|nr:GFA family protein [Paracoccaceae bacterium]
MSDTIQGHCLCGAVTIRVAGHHDPRPGACHCRMCQRWSGGLFLCFEADAGGVTIEGPVTHYASSEFAERAFCSTCGSHLWMRDLNASSYELMPGLFDAVLDAPLRSEVYVDRAMASVQLTGDHPTATAEVYEAKNAHVEGETR